MNSTGCVSAAAGKQILATPFCLGFYLHVSVLCTSFLTAENLEKINPENLPAVK
jgi:hypothetical protein